MGSRINSGKFSSLSERSMACGETMLTFGRNTLALETAGLSFMLISGNGSKMIGTSGELSAGGYIVNSAALTGGTISGPTESSFSKSY